MWVARSIEGVQAAQDRWGIRLIIEINTATLLAEGRSGRGVAAVVEGGVESWEVRFHKSIFLCFMIFYRFQIFYENRF